MSAIESHSQINRGVNWPVIVRTLLVQALVLLALSVAIVGYLNWSSAAAQTEFTDAFRLSASDASHHSLPVHTVKSQAACRPKA